MRKFERDSPFHDAHSDKVAFQVILETILCKVKWQKLTNLPAGGEKCMVYEIITELEARSVVEQHCTFVQSTATDGILKQLY